MIKTSIILMICVFLSKIFGFLREIIIASYYGTTVKTDAFFVAQNIPTIAFAAIGAAISVAVIPIYTKLIKKDEKKASYFINNLITISMLITTFLMIICIVLSKEIVYLVAPSLSGEGIELASKILKIFSVTIYFTMFSYILGGMLNSHNKFYVPQLAAIPYNIISVLAVMFFSKQYDIWALVIGTIIGMFVQTIVHIIPITKFNKYKVILNFKEENFKKLLILSWPMVITVLFQQLNLVVDKNIASSFQIGSISAINYSNRIIGIIYGIFSVSLMTVLYARFNELVIQKQKKYVYDLLVKSLKIVLLVTLPFTVLSLIFDTDIISVIFGRGAFDANSISLTSEVYLFYSLSIFSMAANDIILRCYYSLDNSKTPMIITIICVIINIILSIILSKILGFKGIAIGTSVAMIIQTIILFIYLKNKEKFNVDQVHILDFIKIIISNIFMFIILYFISRYLKINIVLVKLVVFGLIGIIIYIILLYLLKISIKDEVTKLLKLKKHKLHKKEK